MATDSSRVQPQAAFNEIISLILVTANYSNCDGPPPTIE